MVITLGKPVIRVLRYMRYPASYASCARIMERRLFFSRKLQAAKKALHVIQGFEQHLVRP